MMQNIPGCKRMVFIRSGNYDYAEVEFDGAAHLVGRNNVGKSTVIGAVQFLFVPDQSDMRFDGHTLEETRRYYFKHPTSYILFECFSAETQSFVTVGLRGTGAIGGFRFERFAFPGRYERGMFVDGEERAREFDTIKAAIIAQRKHYRALEPRDLRAALIGIWDDKQLNLGIIPLRDGASTDRFVHLFRNLLKLNKMEQEMIKQTLVEVYRRDFTTPTIDLQKDHEAQFSKVERESRILAQHETIEKGAQDLTDALDKLRSSQVLLKPLHGMLLAAHTQQTAAVKAAQIEANGVVEAFGDRMRNLTRRKQDASAQQLDVATQLGDITRNLTAFSKLRATYQYYVPEIEASVTRTLKSEIEGLRRKLYSATDKSIPELEAELSRCRKELAEAIRKRDKHHQLFGAYLVKQVGENQVRDVFRILNPRLLDQEVGSPEGITVTDPAQLSAALEHIDQLIDAQDKQFDGHGVRFPMAGVTGHKGVIPDLDQLARDIAALEENIGKLEERLNDARQAQILRTDLDAKDNELKAREQLHAGYETYLQETDAQSERLARQTELEARRDTLEAEQIAADNELEALNGNYLEARSQLANLGNDLLALTRDVFEAPDDDWAEDPQAAAAFKGLPYATLAHKYREAYRLQESTSSRLHLVVSQIEGQIQDGLAGVTSQAKALTALEMIESLPDRRAAYDSLWAGLVTSIKTSISEMLKDVSRLQDKVTEFNRRLGGVQVSNLRSVSMQIVEDHGRIRTYQALFHEGGLFDGGEDTKRAVEEVAKLIRGAHAKVSLTELFGVEFKVEYEDGSTKTFSKLDTIESTGTTMMIKALVNMVLMRDMMKKDRRYAVPFYIDECNMVDEVNLKGLVRTALSLGFVPVLASTMPVAVAQNLYFVRWVKAGKAIIEPKDHMRRREVNVDRAAA